MVKVAEDDINSSALRTEGVLHRNLDIVEGDVCGSGGGGVGCLDGFGRDVVIALDENDRKSLLCVIIL